MIMNDLVYTFW